MFTGLMECVLPIESTTISRSPSTTSSTTPIPKKAGSGTLATLLSIFRNEGYLGLYKGLSPTLVMSVPNTVLYFTAYDEISMILRRNHVTNFANNSMNGESKSTATIEDIEDAKRQPYIPLMAGSTARLLASLATAPLELIRTRQASNTKAQHGMMEEFHLLLRTNGISSLYVGLAPTLWRDVPFSAIYWLFLERFRNALGDSEELGGWGGSYYREREVDIPPGIEASHAFVSGAGAGSIAAAFTT